MSKEPNTHNCSFCHGTKSIRRYLIASYNKSEFWQLSFPIIARATVTIIIIISVTNFQSEFISPRIHLISTFETKSAKFNFLRCLRLLEKR